MSCEESVRRRVIRVVRSVREAELVGGRVSWREERGEVPFWRSV